MSCVPVFINWNGRNLVAWDCDKYTVGGAGIDLVLKELSISERDYFGLQYIGKNGTVRWLNLRNPTLRELKIAGASTPYQVTLRVKFFVPPKQIFLPETRFAFYTEIREAILKRSFSIPNSFMPRVLSLLAQIDLGDAGEDMADVYRENYVSVWDDALTDLVYVRHLGLSKSHKDKNVSDFLREVSSLPDYGVEHHRVQGHNGKVLMIQLGVKDLGIFMDSDHSKGTKIPLKDLNGAKVKGKSIFFSTNKYKSSIVPMSPTVQNTRVIADLELEFAEEQDARIIYRALLERHLFYCRSTASDLSEMPHFNSRWELIKAKIHPNKADKYRLFSYDVTRTAKEAFQHNKKLFSFSESSDLGLPQSPLLNSTVANSLSNGRQCSPSTLAQRRTMTAEDMEPHVYFGKPRRPQLTRTSSLKGENNKISRSTAIGIPLTPKTAFETSSSGSEKFTFSPPSDTHPMVFAPLPPTPTPVSPSTTFSFLPSTYSLKLKDAKTAPESISSSTGSSSPEEEMLMNFSDTIPLIPNVDDTISLDQPILLDPVPATKLRSKQIQESDEVPPPLPAKTHRLKQPYYGFQDNSPCESETPPPPPPKPTTIFTGNSDSDITTSSVMSSPENPRKQAGKFAHDALPLSPNQLRQFSSSDEQKSRTDWECKLCTDASISTVFIPCGHMLFCRACAHKVRNCPLCNMEILLTQTVCLPSSKHRKDPEGQKSLKAPSCASSLSPSLSPSVSSDLKFEDSSNENIFESWKVSQLAH
jgi:hypothetical protein